jgi:hypothetical protein
MSLDIIDCSYLNEPLLIFGDRGMHVDPKAGIARYGPYSYAPARRHPSTVRVGFIGTAETIEKSRHWLEANAAGVKGDAKHPEFPGYQRDRGFFSQLLFDSSWAETLTQSELNEVLSIKSSRERFEAMLGLLDTKMRLLTDHELAPEYVIIGLPNIVHQRCRAVDYHDKQLGIVHRDLRRAFKGLAMRYRTPTQLLRQPTMEGRDPTHPAKIAWNFFTGLYFKAGGTPWGPVGLTPGTCYVGIGFYNPLGSRFSTIQTSLAQAFDEYGEGLVLRGPDFEWDASKHRSRAPHLSGEQAQKLIGMVLDRYESVLKQTPRRVVVHKTSQYWPDERDGFHAGLRHRVSHYDLIALQRQSTIRLITTSKYPPLRGTRFSVGDLDFLYTNGFITELNEFHGTHVPSPLRISDHVGQDTPRDTLLNEILILTKMNCNSARLGGTLPITITFSDLVGEVLREVPSDREPLPQFKYYI